MCPAAGGSFNHRRCLYFGMYRNKRGEKVAVIEGVVDIISPGNYRLLWNNCDKKNTEIKEAAINKHAMRRSEEYPTRVFLLGQLFDTDFIKDSPGGMYSLKQYFDISELNVNNAEELVKF